jgi:hypothetical protein
MPPLFRPTDISIGQLINHDLKNQALQYAGNPTLKIYWIRQIISDRGPKPTYGGELIEALYVDADDQRLAQVAWRGTVYLYEHVESFAEAFEQYEQMFLDKMGE